MESFRTQFREKTGLLWVQLGIFRRFWKPMHFGNILFPSSCELWGYGYTFSSVCSYSNSIWSWPGDWYSKKILERCRVGKASNVLCSRYFVDVVFVPLQSGIHRPNAAQRQSRHCKKPWFNPYTAIINILTVGLCYKRIVLEILATGCINSLGWLRYKNSKQHQCSLSHIVFSVYRKWV